jgi:hypothetical protein
MATDELACTYASLILHDAGASVTSAALTKLIEAANVKVTPFWPAFFESNLKNQNLDTLILSAGSAGKTLSPSVPNLLKPLPLPPVVLLLLVELPKLLRPLRRPPRSLPPNPKKKKWMVLICSNRVSYKDPRMHLTWRFKSNKVGFWFLNIFYSCF